MEKNLERGKEGMAALKAVERNNAKEVKVFLYPNDIREVLLMLWAASYGKLLGVQQETHPCISENSSLNVDKGKMDAFVEIGNKFGFDIIEKSSSESKTNISTQKLGKCEVKTAKYVFKVLDELETKWKKELNDAIDSHAKQKSLETVGKIVALEQVKDNLNARMLVRV
jgi:hypothetical protein